MKTIRVQLGGELFEETDRAVRETGRCRSALVRDALREHLRRLDIQWLEDRNGAGYAAYPPTTAESSAWELMAAWPEK